jgi:hypothetical protein
MHSIFVLLEFKIAKGKGSVCRAHTWGGWHIGNG